MFKQVSLLQNWYEHGKLTSSPFALRKTVKRELVVNVYETLEMYFGIEYFIVRKKYDPSIHKRNWLFDLLAQKDKVPCMIALNEVAELTRYLHILDIRFITEFNNLKTTNVEKLRSFYFELYVYRMLDTHGIQNEKMPDGHGKPVEGTCVLNGTNFLYECTKPSIPNRDRLDVTFHVANECLIMFHKLTRVPPFHGIIKFNEPLCGAHRSYFERILNDLSRYLTQCDQSGDVAFNVSGKLGEIDVSSFDIFKVASSGDKKPDIIFYGAHPHDERGNNWRIKWSFPVLEYDLDRRLESVIKKKKEQHKESKYVNQIIFMDAQRLPEINMGLFHRPEMIDIDRVRRVYSKLRLDSIICIITREYENGRPEANAHIVTNGRLEKEADELRDKLSRI